MTMQRLGRRTRAWRALAIGGVALAATLATGCGEPRTTDADIAVITETELDQMIAQQGDRLLIVDVRPAAAFQAEHIPNAINIPMPQLSASTDILNQARRIVVYGEGWADPLSSAAAKSLMRMGYSNVWEFKGGLTLWKDAKRGTVTE